jgi:serine/threonine protein kinase
MLHSHDESHGDGPSNASSAALTPPEGGLVVAALEEYRELLRGGRRPVRAEFLGRHRSIAGLLPDRLDGLDFVEDAVRDLDPTGSAGVANADALLSARLGEYRIIREVGRGGMAIVYEAEQLPLGRRVALKVLPSTASLDPRQRQRFQVEAQAAALLHHVHIVPVFGIGCDRGIHYYAMQFIEGRSLTEIIRDVRDGGPGDGCAQQLAGSAACNREYFEMAAQLGLQASLALEHAHEIGVIHRDIKPSNLLIDNRGNLWVADFGLARLPQEGLDLTRTGDLVGTLRYMSPEQVRGGRSIVDAQTDVYSLGVTLYELVTLRPAFDSCDRDAMLRRILDEEPASPRRLQPSIPRDLETIILKAMEKEPSSRYRSARELADDLKRYLDDQPIQAKRPSLVDRAVKWSRRHRTAVVASLLALLITLATTITVLWDAKRRTDAAFRAYRAATNKEFAALFISVGALDHVTAPMLAHVDSNSALGDEARRAVSFAVSCYDYIGKTFENDDKLREMAAKAFRQAGRARTRLGDPRGRQDYGEAIRLFESLTARFPDHLWYNADLIESRREYANLLTATKCKTDAESSTRRALEIAEGLLGNKDADRHCFSMQLAGPFNNLAWDLVRRAPSRPGDMALALRIAQQAVEWEPERAAYWNTLGVARYRAGDYPAAALALQKSMDLNNGGDAGDWFFLAAVFHKLGDRPLARRWYDQAVAQLKRSSETGQARLAELQQFREEAAGALGLTETEAGTLGLREVATH